MMPKSTLLLLSLFAALPFAGRQAYADNGEPPAAAARAELGQVSAQQLQSMQQNGQPLVVDIRTEKEWQATGVIPGSRKLQSFNSDGQFDAEKWLADLQKLKTSPDQAVILVCRSGNRSSKVGELLARKGQANIYHLNDGIQSWIKSGYPVQPD